MFLAMIVLKQWSLLLKGADRRMNSHSTFEASNVGLSDDETCAFITYCKYLSFETMR